VNEAGRRERAGPATADCKEDTMTILPEARALLFPLPVALVTCRARRADAASDNIIPLSWVGIVDWRPHMVSICIGEEKHSARVIGERREIGLSVAPVSLMEAVDRCGSTHGDQADKFALTGLTRAAAARVDAPLIAECPVGLECHVVETVDLNTHRMFIAEVLATHAREEFLRADGTPDLARMDVLCFADDQYWALGRRLESLYYTRPKS